MAILKLSKRGGIFENEYIAKGEDRVMRKNISIGAIVIMMACGAAAQNWGEMQFIDFDEYPPFGPPGIFNPSYCQIDSVLYFDNYLRYYQGSPGEIWAAHFEGGISYNAAPLPYPINLPDQPEIKNVMPAISYSGDTLFFCSNRPGTRGGFDIWMSVKADTIWSEPVNLGDSINSELSELSPHYASRINTLFFDRLEHQIGFHFGLYASIYIGGNNWQNAQRMPDIINPIDYGSNDAYYSELDSTLYFNIGFFGEDICISNYLNGIWTEPRALSENVNGLWIPNVNNWVATRGTSLSSDGQLLFYSKDIWEYNCIDFTSTLFFSEKTVGIVENNDKPTSSVIELNIFPNPSNSSFNISFESDGEPFDLSICNILGQVVQEYHNCTAPAITWDGTDNGGRSVSSGIYFVRIISGKEVITKKLMLQK